MLKAVLLVAVGIMLAVAVRFVIEQIASFRAQSPEDYVGTTPVFDVRQALNGPMDAEGVIYGPTGRVASRFTARMTGVWNGHQGTLKEEFKFATGREQVREWTLRVGNDGKLVATAPDVIGEGTGEQSGSAVVLRYRLKLADDAGGHVLDVVDWMYLLENGSIVNRSEMRKFGLKVAELVATFRPVTP